MQKTKLLALLLFWSSISLAQSQQLNISHNGTNSKVNIADIGSITFSNNNMLVNPKDGSLSSVFSIPSVRVITFDLLEDEEPLNTFTPFAARSDMHLFPNPVLDLLKISLSEGSSQGYIEIYNQEGRFMLSQQVSSSENTLQVSHLPAGLYIIRMGDGQSVRSKTFVKN